MEPALARARAAVRRAIPSTGCVLVGCSGGADSLALAAATALEAPGRAGLVSVDHGLQAGSRARAEAVVTLGRRLGLAPALAVTVDAAPTGGGPEGAARDARLAALAAAAVSGGAVAVLVGHTRDDQAEQVLLGLARGSGARSLAGMPASRPLARGVALLRPLLGLPRTDTAAVCAELGLPGWDDPHNADPAYARARVRVTALPALEAALGPGVAAALARTADLLRADTDALDLLAVDAHAAAAVEGGLGVAALAGLPAALRARVLRRAAAAAGARSLSAAHVQALDALVTGWHGQGPADLPGGVRGGRRGGVLALERSPIVGA